MHTQGRTDGLLGSSRVCPQSSPTAQLPPQGGLQTPGASCRLPLIWPESCNSRSAGRAQSTQQEGAVGIHL